MEDDLKRIASRIRAWRDEAGLTLQKLGDRSGVSASTIHKIENMQTVPTILILIKVANGLNRRPSELLDESDFGNQVAILREKDRQKLSMSDHTAVEHLIGMIPRNHIDVWRVFLEANRGAGAAGADAWCFQGEMVLFVEDGCMDVELSGESYTVWAGDSIHFDTNLPHRWVAGEGASATIIVVAMIPERLQADLMSRAAALGRVSSLDEMPSEPSESSVMDPVAS